MSVAFVTRNPTQNEVERIRLVLSTFRDGSGMLSDAAGQTLPGWRDDERALAAVLGGYAPESKAVFDVVVPSTDKLGTDYGLSVKSKELARRAAIGDLGGSGRVYMELSNSPAKLWAAVHDAGATETDFAARQKPDVIGQALLRAVKSWHEEAGAIHSATQGRTLDLANSVYLVLSYSGRKRGTSLIGERDYQWHAFELAFPSGITWSYRSARCLTGEDPAHPGECLFDWYPFSGGQLKYYPRAQYARYSSAIFHLAVPTAMSLIDKAARYWPDEWRSAGGSTSATAESIAIEIESLAKLAPDEHTRAVLLRAVDDIRRLS